jgi:hypothetical protein
MSLKPLNLLNLHSAGKQECFEQLSLQNTAAAAQSVRSERGTATDLSRMQVVFSWTRSGKVRICPAHVCCFFRVSSWTWAFAWARVEGMHESLLCIQALGCLHTSYVSSLIKQLGIRRKHWSCLQCVYQMKCPGTFFFRMP